MYRLNIHYIFVINIFAPDADAAIENDAKRKIREKSLRPARNPRHARRDAVVYRKSHFKRLESTCEVLDPISICRRSGVRTRGRGCSGGGQPSGDSRFMHFIFRRTLIPRRTTWPTGVILNLWSEIIFDHGSVIGSFFPPVLLIPRLWSPLWVSNEAVYSTDRFVREKTWGNGPRVWDTWQTIEGGRKPPGWWNRLISYLIKSRSGYARTS